MSGRPFRGDASRNRGPYGGYQSRRGNPRGQSHSTNIRDSGFQQCQQTWHDRLADRLPGSTRPFKRSDVRNTNNRAHFRPRGHGINCARPQSQNCIHNPVLENTAYVAEEEQSYRTGNLESEVSHETEYAAEEYNQEGWDDCYIDKGGGYEECGVENVSELQEEAPGFVVGNVACVKQEHIEQNFEGESFYEGYTGNETEFQGQGSGFVTGKEGYYEQESVYGRTYMEQVGSYKDGPFEEMNDNCDEANEVMAESVQNYDGADDVCVDQEQELYGEAWVEEGDNDPVLGKKCDSVQDWHSEPKHAPEKTTVARPFVYNSRHGRSDRIAPGWDQFEGASKQVKLTSLFKGLRNQKPRFKTQNQQLQCMVKGRKPLLPDPEIGRGNIKSAKSSNKRPLLPDPAAAQNEILREKECFEKRPLLPDPIGKNSLQADLLVEKDVSSTVPRNTPVIDPVKNKTKLDAIGLNNEPQVLERSQRKPLLTSQCQKKPLLPTPTSVSVHTDLQVVSDGIHDNSSQSFVVNPGLLNRDEKNKMHKNPIDTDMEGSDSGIPDETVISGENNTAVVTNEVKEFTAQKEKDLGMLLCQVTYPATKMFHSGRNKHEVFEYSHGHSMETLPPSSKESLGLPIDVFETQNKQNPERFKLVQTFDYGHGSCESYKTASLAESISLKTNQSSKDEENKISVSKSSSKLTSDLLKDSETCSNMGKQVNVELSKTLVEVQKTIEKIGKVLKLQKKPSEHSTGVLESEVVEAQAIALVQETNTPNAKVDAVNNKAVETVKEDQSTPQKANEENYGGLNDEMVSTQGNQKAVEIASDEDATNAPENEINLEANNDTKLSENVSENTKCGENVPENTKCDGKKAGENWTENSLYGEILSEKPLVDCMTKEESTATANSTGTGFETKRVYKTYKEWREAKNAKERTSAGITNVESSDKHFGEKRKMESQKKYFRDRDTYRPRYEQSEKIGYEGKRYQRHGRKYEDRDRYLRDRSDERERSDYQYSSHRSYERNSDTSGDRDRSKYKSSDTRGYSREIRDKSYESERSQKQFSKRYSSSSERTIEQEKPKYHGEKIMHNKDIPDGNERPKGHYSHIKEHVISRERYEKMSSSHGRREDVRPENLYARRRSGSLEQSKSHHSVDKERQCGEDLKSQQQHVKSQWEHDKCSHKNKSSDQNLTSNELRSQPVAEKKAAELEDRHFSAFLKDIEKLVSNSKPDNDDSYSSSKQVSDSSNVKQNDSSLKSESTKKGSKYGKEAIKGSDSKDKTQGKDSYVKTNVKDTASISKTKTATMDKDTYVQGNEDNLLLEKSANGMKSDEKEDKEVGIVNKDLTYQNVKDSLRISSHAFKQVLVKLKDIRRCQDIPQDIKICFDRDLKYYKRKKLENKMTKSGMNEKDEDLIREKKADKCEAEKSSKTVFENLHDKSTESAAATGHDSSMTVSKGRDVEIKNTVSLEKKRGYTGEPDVESQSSSHLQIDLFTNTNPLALEGKSEDESMFTLDSNDSSHSDLFSKFMSVLNKDQKKSGRRVSEESNNGVQDSTDTDDMQKNREETSISLGKEEVKNKDLISVCLNPQKKVSESMKMELPAVKYVRKIGGKQYWKNYQLKFPKVKLKRLQKADIASLKKMVKQEVGKSLKKECGTSLLQLVHTKSSKFKRIMELTDSTSSSDRESVVCMARKQAKPLETDESSEDMALTPGTEREETKHVISGDKSDRDEKETPNRGLSDFGRNIFSQLNLPSTSASHNKQDEFDWIVSGTSQESEENEVCRSEKAISKTIKCTDQENTKEALVFRRKIEATAIQETLNTIKKNIVIPKRTPTAALPNVKELENRREKVITTDESSSDCHSVASKHGHEGGKRKVAFDTVIPMDNRLCTESDEINLDPKTDGQINATDDNNSTDTVNNFSSLRDRQTRVASIDSNATTRSETSISTTDDAGYEELRVHSDIEAKRNEKKDSDISNSSTKVLEVCVDNEDINSNFSDLENALSEHFEIDIQSEDESEEIFKEKELDDKDMKDLQRKLDEGTKKRKNLHESTDTSDDNLGCSYSTSKVKSRKYAHGSSSKTVWNNETTGKNSGGTKNGDSESSVKNRKSRTHSMRRKKSVSPTIMDHLSQDLQSEESGEEGDVEDNISVIDTDEFVSVPGTSNTESYDLKGTDFKVDIDSEKLLTSEEDCKQNMKVNPIQDLNECVEENGVERKDTVDIKDEPAWLKLGYTQEPDTIFLSDDDNMIMSFSQPVINLVSSESENEKGQKNDKVYVKVKDEDAEFPDFESNFIDEFGDVSSDDRSDKGSDFDPSDLVETIKQSNLKMLTALIPDNSGMSSSEDIFQSQVCDSKKAKCDLKTHSTSPVKAKYEVKTENISPSTSDFSSTDEEILMMSIANLENRKPLDMKKPGEMNGNRASNSDVTVINDQTNKKPVGENSVDEKENEEVPDQLAYLAETQVDEHIGEKKSAKIGSETKTNKAKGSEDDAFYLAETQVDDIDEDTTKNFSVFDFHSEHFEDISDFDDSDSECIENKVQSGQQTESNSVSRENDAVAGDVTDTYELSTQIADFLEENNDFSREVRTSTSKSSHKGGKTDADKKQENIFEAVTQVDVNIIDVSSKFGQKKEKLEILNQNNTPYNLQTQVNQNDYEEVSVFERQTQQNDRVREDAENLQEFELSDLDASEKEPDDPQQDMYLPQTQPGTHRMSHIRAAKLVISYHDFGDSSDQEINKVYSSATQHNTSGKRKIVKFGDKIRNISQPLLLDSTDSDQSQTDKAGTFTAKLHTDEEKGVVYYDQIQSFRESTGIHEEQIYNIATQADNDDSIALISTEDENNETDLKPAYAEPTFAEDFADRNETVVQSGMTTEDDNVYLQATQIDESVCGPITEEEGYLNATQVDFKASFQQTSHTEGVNEKDPLMDTQLDEIDLDDLPEEDDPYMAATQVNIPSSLPSKEIKNTSECRVSKDHPCTSKLKRTKSESTSAHNRDKHIPLKKPRLELERTTKTTLFTEPQKLKSTAEKRSSGLVLGTRKLSSDNTSKNTTENNKTQNTSSGQRVQIEVLDGNESNMWLSKNRVPDKSISGKGRSGKRKRKEDPSDMIRARMQAARCQIKDRLMQTAAQPTSTVDNNKRKRQLSGRPLGILSLYLFSGI